MKGFDHIHKVSASPTRMLQYSWLVSAYYRLTLRMTKVKEDKMAQLVYRCRSSRPGRNKPAFQKSRWCWRPIFLSPNDSVAEFMRSDK